MPTTKSKLISFRHALKTSRQLLGLVWEVDRHLLIGYMIAVLLPAILPFLNAYIYAQIINFVVRHISGQSQSYSVFYTLISLRLVALLIQDVAFTAQRRYDKQLWTRLPMHLYQKVLASITSLDVEYFENSDFKDKLERVRDSFNWRPLNMFSDISYSFQGIIQVVIAAVSLIYLNWLFAILILLSAIPTLIYQTKAAKAGWTIWEADTSARKRFWYLSDLLQNGQSVKELKLFQLSKSFLDDLKETQLNFVKENEVALKKEYYRGIFANIVNIVAYIIIEICIIFGALAKKISLGSLTYFTTVLINYQTGINNLFRSVSNIYDKSQYVSEMFDVLETKPRIVFPPNPVSLKPKSVPRIEFKNVTFAYPGTNKKVLDNFSLVIEAGRKIAFVGENGAGKTTIVKLLARFYDVDRGEILIDGVNIKQLDLNNWYDHLGVLFQDFLKYEYSLRDNIHFGRIKAENEMTEIMQAAKQAGAHEVATGLPNRYEQMLGKTFQNGIDLSIGQWQKVALARGFYRNAAVLVLDEPTASIDAKAESEIFKQVEALSSNKTVLIISHRFSTVRNADKIYVLDKGKIKEQGSHKELMSENGIYAELFNLQAKAYK
jgi:ATP-binding cassette subfamily B protein